MPASGLDYQWQCKDNSYGIQHCNSTPSADDYEDLEEQLEECSQYTVEDLFCCEYAKYFWQAVRIRYP